MITEDEVKKEVEKLVETFSSDKFEKELNDIEFEMESKNLTNSKKEEDKKNE